MRVGEWVGVAVTVRVEGVAVRDWVGVTVESVGEGVYEAVDGVPSGDLDTVGVAVKVDIVRLIDLVGVKVGDIENVALKVGVGL